MTKRLIGLLFALFLAGCNTPTMRTTVDVYLFPGANRADGCTIYRGDKVRVVDLETVTDPEMTVGRFAKVKSRACTGWVREALIKE